MNPVCHSSGCRKIAMMEAATINAYGETWLPYCEVHLAVIVAQEALLVRQIGKQKPAQGTLWHTSILYAKI